MKLRFPKFSLLTLLLLAVAIGAGMGLSLRWEPWVKTGTSSKISMLASMYHGKLKVRQSNDGLVIVENGVDRCKLERVNPMPLAAMPSEDSKYVCALQGGTLDLLTVLHSLKNPDESTEGAGVYSIWDAADGKLLKRIEFSNATLKVYSHEDWTTPVLSLENLRTGLQPTNISGMADTLAVYLQNGAVKFIPLFSSNPGIEITQEGFIAQFTQFNREGDRALVFSQDQRRGMLVNLKSGKYSVFDFPGRVPMRNCRFRSLPYGTFAICEEKQQERVYLMDSETGKNIRLLQDSMDGGELSTSHDGTRVTLGLINRENFVWDTRTGKRLSLIGKLILGSFDPNARDPMQIRGIGAGVNGKSEVHTYERRRPEYWWGIAWLPESWVLLAALIGLGVQAFHSYRRLRAS